jgi:holo-[acyl-carrier protein] synthase
MCFAYQFFFSVWIYWSSEAALVEKENRSRFAAKEAFSKAIGLGMHMPMTWRSLQTLNQSSGKPYTKYSGALADFMLEKQWHAQVTVTDEQDMVMAFVVVSYGTPIVSTFDPSNYIG